MPRIKLPFKENFITFHNIEKTYGRLENILKQFNFTSFENFFQK